MSLIIKSENSTAEDPGGVEQIIAQAENLLKKVLLHEELTRQLTKAAIMTANAVKQNGKVFLVGDRSDGRFSLWSVKFSGWGLYDVKPISGIIDDICSECPANHGDILFALTTGVRDTEVAEIASAARVKGVATVGLSGAMGRSLANAVDVSLWAPSIVPNEVRLICRMYCHSIWLEVAEILYRKVYR